MFCYLSLRITTKINSIATTAIPIQYDIQKQWYIIQNKNIPTNYMKSWKEAVFLVEHCRFTTNNKVHAADNNDESIR